MKAVRFIVKLLLVIGALNWGLIGFFQYDLLSDLFGGMGSTGARILYAIVGLAGLFAIGSLCRCCGCGPNCSCCSGSSKCSGKKDF